MNHPLPSWSVDSPKMYPPGGFEVPPEHTTVNVLGGRADIDGRLGKVYYVPWVGYRKV